MQKKHKLDNIKYQTLRVKGNFELFRRTQGAVLVFLREMSGTRSLSPYINILNPIDVGSPTETVIL
jgi:hypothetical protein